MVIEYSNILIFSILFNLCIIILSIFNLLHVLIFMECIWISIYIYLIINSIIFDSYYIFLIGLYCLCLATAETTIGLSLIILKFSLDGNSEVLNLKNSRNLFFLRKSKIIFINDKIK